MSAVGSSAGNTGATAQQQVLLVEDNQLNQMVAEGMLRLLGYECRSVTDGLQAVAALHAAFYPIVLMDVQMPELDGYEASRRIRAELPHERQPYIIALTANAMAGDAERCRAAGMDDYLAKPLTKLRLSAALERASQS